MNTKTGRAIGWGALIGVFGSPVVTGCIAGSAVVRQLLMGTLLSQSIEWVVAYVILISIVGAPGGLLLGALLGCIVDCMLASELLTRQSEAWAAGAGVGLLFGAANGAWGALALGFGAANSRSFAFLGAVIGLVIGVTISVKVWRLHNWTRIEAATFEAPASSAFRHSAKP